MQNWATQHAAKFLSKELQVNIEIKSLYFKPFTSLNLKGLYIEDQEGDTLIYTENLDANLVLSQLLKNQVSIEKIQIQEGVVNLKTLEDSTNNLQFLIDYFSPNKKDQKRNIQLQLKDLILENSKFSYINRLITPDLQKKQIDFNNIFLQDINTKLGQIVLLDDGVQFQLDYLDLKDKTGFEIKEFSGDFSIGNDHINVTDLILKTNESIINESISLHFQEWKDFKDFINKVNVEWKSINSFVASKDIEYFSEEIEKVQFKSQVAGEFKGTVSSMFGENVSLKLGNGSELRGYVSVEGLPKIDETWFDVELYSLKTNILDIEQLTRGFSNNPSFNLPNFLEAFETVEFEGKFEGYYHDFLVDGIILSNLGNVQSHLQFILDEDIHYKGNISSEDFNPGMLMQTPSLTHLEFHGILDGKNLSLSKIEGFFDIEIPQISYEGKNYKALRLEGDYHDKILKTNFNSKDDFANINQDIHVHFLKDSMLIESKGTVHYLNLNQIPHYSIEEIILKRVDVDLNTLITKGSIQNAKLNLGGFETENKNKSVQLEPISIELKSIGPNFTREVLFNSDFVKGNIKGKFDFNTLEPLFTNLLHRYAPHLPESRMDVDGQDFQVDFILEPSELWSFLSPTLEINKSSFLKASIKNSQDLTLDLNLNEFSYDKFFINKINLHAYNFRDQLISNLSAEKMKVPDFFEVNNFLVKQTLKEGISQFESNWMVDSAGSNQMHLVGGIHLAKEKIDFTLDSANVMVNNEKWQLDDRIHVQWTPEEWLVESFLLKNAKQEINARGSISKNTKKPLLLEFQNFNISNLNAFIANSPVKFNGILNGNSEIHRVLDNPYAQSDLQVDNFTLNDKVLGQLDISAELDQFQEYLNVNIDLKKDNIKKLQVTGGYYYKEKENPLDLKAHYESFDIELLETFISDISDKIEGKITGNSTLTGTILNPKITGTALITGGKFRVNYLNTEYNVLGTIQSNNTILQANNLQIFDRFSNRAILNGLIDLNRVRDPHMSLQVQAQNFHSLNTTLRDNPLYFGTAFGTGNISLQGRSSALNINVQAKTEENTEIYIPLNYSSNLVENEFIRFNKKTDTLNPNPTIENTRINAGITLNMDLQVTPQADIKITTDLGELSGVGEGNLLMKISNLGDFEMFGDYLINNGLFNFSAQDFINKIFEIKPGGSIRWTGKPAEAQLNLTAFYQQRTNVSALYNAAGRPPNEQRVLAQAEMLLNGNLLRPDISFNLNFPQDPYIKDELLSYLSDVNNVNQQALSLIVRRSFTPTSSTDFTRELNNTLIGAGTEIAFNQLNNILTESLNLNFVDFQIRSLNDASASFRLFRDRLILSGGITDRRNDNINDFSVFSDRIATDAELRYLIWNDGRLVLRAANKLNTRHFLLNPTDEYISSVGLIYRREFNSFNEFFNRLLGNRIRKKASESAEDSDSDTPQN